MDDLTKPCILGFHGPNRWLSNFELATVVFDGKEYSTVEAAYQAAKTLDPIQREEIRTAPRPGKAKILGQRVTLREDWESIKLLVMLEFLRQKFQLCHLKQRLLDTGDSYLEETNTWNDTFWGVCNGVGQNMLGKLLMQVRDELRQ